MADEKKKEEVKQEDLENVNGGIGIGNLSQNKDKEAIGQRRG